MDATSCGDPGEVGLIRLLQIARYDASGLHRTLGRRRRTLRPANRQPQPLHHLL